VISTNKTGPAIERKSLSSVRALAMTSNIFSESTDKLPLESGTPSIGNGRLSFEKVARGEEQCQPTDAATSAFAPCAKRITRARALGATSKNA
jgi:4-hydroxy-L-threonine phosphate dehydrogenase PdxA